MRILVLGAGGTGGYFGGRLAQAGADVTFLVRPARAERLRQHGLVIRSPQGDAQLPVQLITADQAPAWGHADLVLLSCKAYDLDDAITAIRPVVGERTVVLPVLNGLAHLERLDAAFGESRVLGGLCHISATTAPDGAVLHLSIGQGPAVHSITFGERTPHAPRERTEAIRDVFATANFDSVLAENVMQDMWEKFVFLTSLASMTCLMRATVGEIVATDEGRALNEAMFAACEEVAAASGYPIRQAARERGLQVLTQAGSPLTASMLRDLESGARVEADHIVGDMLRRGRALGTDVSLLRVAFAHLQAYQQRVLRAAAG
ncbi:2-dehydropantoate 2-reductase [Ralstonia mannitolilytica]|uniref:2-dehydropantoate 2-reductase n=1 Tax=Ralstonia mannitolilytica TaxID=105219 RepID=UPI0028F55316|nr:2-dehydropantoate 2-reductase [Ralstonia mannitolilytica]CAJ0742004.1 2-dehydropantoate 2-reductase [Ralstonia mannitolilytica]